MSNTINQPTNQPTSQSATQSATARADALLTLWGQRLNPAGNNTPSDEAGTKSPGLPPAGTATHPEPALDMVRRADSLLDRLGHRLSGRGLVETVAYGYVAVAIRTGRVADAAQKTWQESVQAALRQQEQQAARTGGGGAARQVAAEEKKGEQVLKQTETDAEGDAEKGVDVAAEVAA